MQIHILHLGTLKARALEMVKPLSETEIGLKYKVDATGYMELALNSLLVIEDGRVVLIDPGCADFLPARIMKEYGFEQEESIDTLLHQVGFSADRVTDVLFTHLHFDHGSGAFIRQPGKIVKRFPNARYHVLKEHYEYAIHPHISEAKSFFTPFFKYLDAIHWLEEWGEPWMRFRISNGHTHGMVVPVIKADACEIYYPSDLLPMEVFLEPEVFSGYDLNPELIAREKLELLSELNESDRIIFFHDSLTDSVIYE